MSLTKATYSMIDGPQVNVKDYGAVADWNGSTGTDNTTAFASAVAAIAALGGGTLTIPPGKYKGILAINTSNIHVIGYGATIGYQNVDATLQVFPGTTIPNNYSFFGGFNSGGVPQYVSPNATFYGVDTVTQGSDTMTITGSSTGLAVGDWCMLMSGQESYSTVSTNHVPTTHQLVKIRDVSGLTIKIESTSDVSFNSSAVYPYLVKWNYLQNVKVSGLSLTNISGGSAAYLYFACGVNGLQFEDISMFPGTAGGILSTAQNCTFTNVVSYGSFTGFSNGRMCDEITLRDCAVYSSTSKSGALQYYFFFSEENVKRLTIDGCTGNNAGVVVSGGSAWTNVNITNSFFEVYKTTYSAIAISSNIGGSYFISDCQLVGNGGAGAYATDPAVCEIAYTTGTVLFNNCIIVQLDNAAKALTCTTGSANTQVNSCTVNAVVTCGYQSNVFSIVTNQYSSNSCNITDGANAVASGVSYGGTTATTVGAAGSASVLPANPLGYLIAYVGSTKVKIPYYTGT